LTTEGLVCSRNTDHPAPPAGGSILDAQDSRLRVV